VEDVMPKFEIEYTYTETHYDYVEVEADDEEGAREIALEEADIPWSYEDFEILNVTELD
jgi:hypothetical protein